MPSLATRRSGLRRPGDLPGRQRRNEIHFHEHVTFSPDVSPLLRDMLWTPETSGGLLVAVAAKQAASFQALCPMAIQIGTVTAGDGHIYVA